jgi:hypothetical protein
VCIVINVNVDGDLQANHCKVLALNCPSVRSGTLVRWPIVSLAGTRVDLCCHALHAQPAIRGSGMAPACGARFIAASAHCRRATVPPLSRHSSRLTSKIPLLSAELTPLALLMTTVLTDAAPPAASTVANPQTARAQSVVDGATVASDAIIAANAVLRPGAAVASGQMWAGNPAVFKRNLTPDEKAYLAKSAASYAGLAAAHRGEDEARRAKLEAL